MKKDTVTGIAAAVIVAGYSVLGFCTQRWVNQKESAERSVAADNREVCVSQTLTETSSYTEAVTSVVTSAVSSDLYTSQTFVTSVSVTDVSDITTTEVSHTTAVETAAETEQHITEPPVTEAEKPVETEPPRRPEPEPQPQPEPEPEPEPQPEPEPEPAPSIPDSASEFQRELFRLVNQRRSEVGVGLLQCTELYNSGASIRASEITEKFDHIRPGGEEREWYTIFTDLGIPAGYMGENIAAGSSTPEDVFNQWCDSPQHYANMINGNYKYIGIGYFNKPDSEYQHYWVQLFG